MFPPNVSDFKSHYQQLVHYTTAQLRDVLQLCVCVFPSRTSSKQRWGDLYCEDSGDSGRKCSEGECRGSRKCGVSLHIHIFKPCLAAMKNHKHFTP